jgi:very-short-patch-repair endonuclease
MDAKVDTPDRRVAEVAARQHGVVTRRQIEAAGLGSKAITSRIRRGQLHRLHRGVYAVGHRAPSWHQRWMAAVLACGDGAMLSHHSAAALWELLRPIKGAVHVSVPSTSGRAVQRGIHLHRCPSLSSPPPGEPSPSPSYLDQEGGRGRRLITYRHNIPVTTIQRTIEDLRTSRFFPPHLLRRAIRQAEHKGHRLEGVESDRTRSDLETLFLDLFRLHRIPPPEVNVKLGRHEVDFLWRSHNLVVEVDSFLYHRGSVSFEDDHSRDLDLRQLGYTVLRFSERQLEDEPESVAADVAQALAVASLPGL